MPEILSLRSNASPGDGGVLYGPLDRNHLWESLKLVVLLGITPTQGQLLTQDAAVYGDDIRATVDIDDERLVNLLEPVFTRMRACMCWPSGVRHTTESKLVKHLKRQWNKDLKALFEEQWLRSQTVTWTPEMFTDKRFGYQNQHAAVNRAHRDVEKLIRRMPSIRPVVMFEKRVRMCYFRAYDHLGNV
ncbi:hypothetical protein F4861DRAFT_387509 [Xylaria intraflava]|nr:hypothetical protein F4861DRAFT_387509 [Xylaria intraflava]